MVSSYDGQHINEIRCGSVGAELEGGSPSSLRRSHAEMPRVRWSHDDIHSLLQKQKSSLEHQRKIFTRALTAAKMGIWECELPGNTLEWTDVVYDMFDLPRDSKLDRAEIVKCYSPASLAELVKLRTQAIAECGGFSMDAEITTKMGNRRWIRITATVESDAGVAVRIFGVKQDITEEKLMLDRMRYLAAHDVMTGLANRSEFQTKLAEFCSFGGSLGEIALLLIDLDGFKMLNDTFGHSVGDDCLRKASKRLRGILGKSPHVSRIGGDEFAVFIDCREETRNVSELGQTIVGELRHTLSVKGSEVTIGASVGIAFANGSSPEDFFKRADAALYAAKNAGRNQFKIFESGFNLAPPRSRTAA